MIVANRSRKSRRGQVSVEHLLVLTMALIALIPGTMLFFQFSKSSNHQMISAQVTRIGDEILKSAEIVTFLGEGSRLRLVINMPNNIQDMRVYNEEMVINFTSITGKNEAVFFPDVTLIGAYDGGESVSPAFHSGLMTLYIKNSNGKVLIWEET